MYLKMGRAGPWSQQTVGPDGSLEPVCLHFLAALNLGELGLSYYAQAREGLNSELCLGRVLPPAVPVPQVRVALTLSEQGMEQPRSPRERSCQGLIHLPRLREGTDPPARAERKD